MTSTIFLRLPNLVEQPADWVELAADNQILASGRLQWPEQLTELASHAQQKSLALVLPVERTLITRVTVPEKQQKHLSKVLPYLLEEHVAGSIDDLHIIAEPVFEQNQVLTVAVDEQYFRDCLQQCQAAGLNPVQVTIDALGLPTTVDRAHLLVSEQRALLRLPDGQAQALALSELSSLLPLLLGETPLKIFSADSTQANEIVAEREEIDHALAFLAQRLRTTLNLRQGEYAPSSAWQEHWQQWRPLVKVLGIAAVVSYLLVIGDLLLMNYRINKIDTAIRESYAQVFPNEANVAQPMASMRGHTKKFSDGASGGGFTGYLAEVAPVVKENPQLVVRGAGYEVGSQALRMDITAPDLGTLNQLVQRFQQMGFSTDLGQASASAGGYSSRLELRRQGEKK